MGKIQEAEDLWRSLEIHDVLEVPATLKPEELRAFFLDIIRSGGLNVDPLAEMLDRQIDEEAVRASPIGAAFPGSQTSRTEADRSEGSESY